MSDVKYQDEVLDIYVRPCAGAVGLGFILMGDKTHSHYARVVERCMAGQIVRRT
jgi:hypothetical protein